MANRTDLSNILINFLKKARYERHIEEGTLEENQFYAVTDGNEKTEYGDLFGNIENQADLYNALYASRLFKMEMCNDPRGYAIVKALKESAKYYDKSKFTVVGNPVITEDGVASGLNASNYVTCIKPDLWNNVSNWHLSWTQYCDFSTDKLTSFLFLGDYQYGYFNYNPGWNAIVLNVYDINNSQIFITIEVVRPKFVPGILKLDIYYSNETGYYFTISQGDKIYTSSKSTKINPLRYQRNNLVQFRQADVDLKNLAMEIDGQLIFTGYSEHTGTDTYPLYNIEIPYYQSKDGVKIVDVAYKPLVDQLYTETGMGNYIIIDETNKTFRLPLPDIYSQIENKTSFTLRKWED